MSEAANLLRQYHRTLGEERWPDQLAAADLAFWSSRSRAPASPGMKAATTAIWNAHVARVENRGSPSACDNALSDAIRSLGT